MSCSTCDLVLKREDLSLLCVACNNIYHATTQCSKMSKGLLDKTLSKGSNCWCCLDCNNKKQNQAITASSLNNGPTINKSNATEYGNISTQQLYNKLIDLENQNKSTAAVIERINSSVSSALLQLQTVTSDLAALKVDFIGSQTNIEVIKTDLLEMRKRFSQQEHTINQMETDLLSNTIELAGVPMRNNENLIDVVLKVFDEGLNFNINADDIDYCDRKSAKKIKNPAIVVRFVRRNLKSTIMEAKYKNKTKLSSKLIDPDSNNIIFVNECLSIRQQQILYEAKIFKKDHYFKYLWIRNGRIMLRAKENEKIFYLRTMADLDKVKAFYS